jgi:hypothetical protein
VLLYCVVLSGNALCCLTREVSYAWCCAGLPADILDGFPALKSFRNDIASLPAVSAHYAKAQDDTRKNGYTPDV